MSSIRQQERNYNLTATFNFKLHVRTRTTRWKPQMVEWKKDDSQRHKCNATQKEHLTKTEKIKKQEVKVEG